MTLADAWEQLHAAMPAGWYVGPPGERHGGTWAIYAFDQAEKAHIGKRSREWTAVGQHGDRVRARDGQVPARARRGEGAAVKRRHGWGSVDAR